MKTPIREILSIMMQDFVKPKRDILFADEGKVKACFRLPLLAVPRRTSPLLHSCTGMRKRYHKYQNFKHGQQQV